MEGTVIGIRRAVRGRSRGTLTPSSQPLELGSTDVKKGRHRRFEEARALKRSTEVVAEPCPECGADPEDDHASWCLFEEDEEDADDREG
jgi:hypothetical protein